MTIVEKAAYLKGLTDGLGIDKESKEGKLWGALNNLLVDMAHEIEDLQESNLDFAEALDDISEDLSYLEELTCDLDTPDFMDDDAFDDICSGDCTSCGINCGLGNDDEYEDEDEDEDDDNAETEDELVYDGVMYDVTCPVCGEELTIDEETLAEGSVACPGCGEILEFEIDE